MSYKHRISLAGTADLIREINREDHMESMIHRVGKIKVFLNVKPSGTLLQPLCFEGSD